MQWIRRVLVGMLIVIPSVGLAAESGPIELFNGKDMTGWTFTLNDKNARMEDVWRVSEGVIHCKGSPVGYIRTEKKYTSYKLIVEWRCTPEKPGNSGVLLRVQEPDKVWPKSIESQLNSGDAGDIWNIDNFRMAVSATSTKDRRTIKLHHSSEKPLGEWNTYEITLDGTNLELKVNGVLQNTARDVEVIPGYIALQSEGAPIEFRKIKLTPLGDETKPPTTMPIRRLAGLDGWHVTGEGNWTLHDGIIEGSQTKATKTYTHVVSDKTYRDFKASLMFKCTEGNSGFYFRTHPDEKGLMHGIQAEIDATKDDGGFYESYGRNWLSLPKPEQVAKFFKLNEWNEMKVEGHGTKVTCWINGTQSAEIDDAKQNMDGVFALQIHGGQDVHVMFKEIKIEPVEEK